MSPEIEGLSQLRGPITTELSDAGERVTIAPPPAGHVLEIEDGASSEELESAMADCGVG